MKKQLLYFWIGVLAMALAPTSLSAQFVSPHAHFTFDVLYLKDSTVLKGWIMEQKIGEYVKLELVGGSLLVVEQERIYKITRERSPYRKISRRRNPFQKPILYRPRGFYQIVDFHLGFPEGEWGNVSLNPAFHYRLGHHWNRWLGTGVGTGLDLFSAGLVIPVFGEVQGYLWDKPNTPYFSVQGGYGFGVAPINWNVVDMEGGLFYQVSLGAKLHTRSKHNWMLSLGWKSQTLDVTQQDGWDWRTGEPLPGLEITRFYRTLVFQVGVSL
jgi:hypothetical protein